MFPKLFQRRSKERSSFVSLLTTILTFLQCISATTFTGRQSLSGVTVFFDTVSITTDSVLVISSGALHYFFSSVINNGELCMYQPGSLISFGMTIAFTSDVYNYGTMVFDDTAATFPMVLQLSGGTFYNSGSIYAKGTYTILYTSSYTIGASNFNNAGLISFDQGSGTGASASLGSGTMTNTGTICVTNTVLTQQATMSGTGCIVLNTSGQLTANTASYSLSGQTVYMSSSSAQVLVSSTGSAVIKVRGFGNSNKITMPYVIMGISYASSTGILTVSHLLGTGYFDIGLG
ncbi:hypothetical protein KAFR_0B06420 [Kazachstania africana CBS 2517]|uniref:Hyphally-regulated cell wall protein N-terminal domain-containing protein n=1 Tax=Kazachstania africana (strain ATCC 22294 / BCRC 22015 / CBS 2517 / CECT 1963 / NBRC 1671 / NRRL Y-8276) TaxID=1071382 RepID=H2ARD8_KAZAF|nr:hypothetical protein KAFR_0B06420 [Kazachstania africana CBS 2517]CCF56938.1 hypothetical protein KAFR_0B06420 [Kazachstania africana CBS 2517]